MPPKRSKQRARPESPAGSGQSPESVADGLANQPELLAAAARYLEQRKAAGDLELPSTPVASGSSKKRAKKQKKADLDELLGGLKDSGTVKTKGDAGSRRAKARPCQASVKLAKYMQGPDRGKFTGRVYYAVTCVFDDNSALQKLIEEKLHKKPRWFADWGAWAVPCPTRELALMMHKHVCESPALKSTQATLDSTLDVTPYDDPAVSVVKFTLASGGHFETERGVLPPSILIAGNAYDFKEFLKAKFKEIRYTDVVIGANKKAAWVLPLDAQTAASGTLLDFCTSLGVTCDEVDLDDESDDESDGEAEAGPSSAFVEREAEEALMDDDE